MMTPFPSFLCFPLTGYCDFTYRYCNYWYCDFNCWYCNYWYCYFTYCYFSYCKRHCWNPFTDRSQHADAAGHCQEPRSLIGSGHLTGPAYC
ncbi:hypothetical protein SAMN04489731_104174 [Amycolatopsis regifaucium]|nr:hypothetical protein SAMN04489731_104174 [Amycolatopsis regifaucium]